jgi:hypothetical protein
VLRSNAPAVRIKEAPPVSASFFLGMVSTMTSSLRYWLSDAAFPAPPPL